MSLRCGGSLALGAPGCAPTSARPCTPPPLFPPSFSCRPYLPPSSVRPAPILLLLMRLRQQACVPTRWQWELSSGGRRAASVRGAHGVRSSSSTRRSCAGGSGRRSLQRQLRRHLHRPPRCGVRRVWCPLARLAPPPALLFAALCFRHSADVRCRAAAWWWCGWVGPVLHPRTPIFSPDTDVGVLGIFARRAGARGGAGRLCRAERCTVRPSSSTSLR